MEKFEQTSQDIKEIEWVKQQVKAELQSLQQNVQQELFYQKEGDKVTYNLDLVKTYLEHIKDRSWSQLTEKNSSAWIMAVQIALEHQGYDVEKVDGIWGDATKAAIESFQGANELVKDGKPGTLTIQKLLEGMGSSTSQAETTETQTETTGTPTKTSGTPTETTETQTETSENPTETSENPTETAETPTKTSGTPTETAENPTETSENPTETAETPTKTSGTPTETAETQTETAETQTEKPQTQTETAKTQTEKPQTQTETAKTQTEKPQNTTEKAGEIKEIDLSTLGAWDENRNFVFKDGVEKTDQKGKYIEIQGKKYYKYKEGMTGLGYNAFIDANGQGNLWYGNMLNGEFYKQVFRYYSDGEIEETHWNKMGNQIKQISKKADGTINWEYNYEYDEKGNLIKLKREGTDNDNYDIAYTRHENGNKKTEKKDHIVGITTEREYDENEKITKEKKTYHDDKPVIEGKFDNEGELIKEEVENQEDEATKSSYTGQVNAYNKQKHGSGTTTFKDKQTEGGYYENGELLIGGKKNGDNYAQQRGTVRLREVYTVDKEKNKYQERTVESWGNRITLLDTASGYTFSTRSGAKLTLPKDLGRKKALNAANLINAAVGIVKQSGNELDYFEADGNRLEADYKVSASNLRYGLQDATLIKNVNEKFGVSAKELAAWLNEYRKELGI